MEMFKERKLIRGQRVEVYRNLHAKSFSVRDAKTKQVVARASSVLIENGICKVSSAGREKVIENQRRSVHAWIVGNFVAADLSRPEECSDKVYYSPYVTDSFILLDTKDKVESAEQVYFEGKYCYISKSPRV